MTNTVRLRGIVRDPFYLEDREDGGTCYVTYVSVMRNSGISDTMQVVIPASVLDVEVCHVYEVLRRIHGTRGCFRDGYQLCPSGRNGLPS